MAYSSGTTSSTRRRPRRIAADDLPPASKITKPRGKPYEESSGPLVPLGVGLLIGAALGAAAALLLAPGSGEDTREWIAEHADDVADRSRSAWDTLAEELGRARRKAGRVPVRARWWMEDRGY